MSIDNEREEFEAWYREKHSNVFGLTDNRLDWCETIGCYEHEFVDGMFHAWKKLKEQQGKQENHIFTDAKSAYVRLTNSVGCDADDPSDKYYIADNSIMRAFDAFFESPTQPAAGKTR